MVSIVFRSIRWFVVVFCMPSIKLHTLPHYHFSTFLLECSMLVCLLEHLLPFVLNCFELFSFANLTCYLYVFLLLFLFLLLLLLVVLKAYAHSLRRVVLFYVVLPHFTIFIVVIVWCLGVINMRERKYTV